MTGLHRWRYPDLRWMEAPWGLERPHTGRSPCTVTRNPDRVCGQ